MSMPRMVLAVLLGLFLSMAPAAPSGEEGTAPGKPGGDAGADAVTSATRSPDAVTGASPDATTGASKTAEKVDLEEEIGEYDFLSGE